MDPLAEVTFEPYSYVGNNPIMFTDPTGMSKDDIVFMGEGGAEVHRIKNDQVNKTFVVDVNAGSVATEGFSESGAQGWIEAKMPGTIPRKYDYNGGSSSTTASKYQQHDYLIAAETSYFNQYKNSGTVPTLNGKMMSGAGGKVPDLDPNVVKAISMIETNLGNIANRGLNNGSQDIMQSNVYYSSTSHDWNSQKTQFGLTKGGGATPAQSVNAGIGLLFLKGLRDPSNINGSQVNKWFGGTDWGNAIRDYNGVSKIKSHFNLQGKVVYRNFVLQMAKEAK